MIHVLISPKVFLAYIIKECQTSGVYGYRHYANVYKTSGVERDDLLRSKVVNCIRLHVIDQIRSQSYVVYIYTTIVYIKTKKKYEKYVKSIVCI